MFLMPAQWDWLVKLVLNYGGMGACCYLLYSLIDKWAAKFLDAHVEQAKATTTQAIATTTLAAAVKEGQDNGREVLMAVRLLADRIDRQHNYLVRIDERVSQELLRRTA
jgi:hypothetical protein